MAQGPGLPSWPSPFGITRQSTDRSRFYAGSGPTSSAHPITRIGAAAASAEMGRECTRGRWRSSMRRLPDADSSQTARRWTREPKRSRRKSGAGGAHWRARPARTPSSGVRNHAELAEAPPRAVRDRPARMRRPTPPFFFQRALVKAHSISDSADKRRESRPYLPVCAARNSCRARAICGSSP